MNKYLKKITVAFVSLFSLATTGYYFNNQYMTEDNFKPLVLPQPGIAKPAHISYEIDNILSEKTEEVDVYKFINKKDADIESKKITEYFNVKSPIVKDDKLKIHKLGPLLPNEPKIMLSYNNESGTWFYKNTDETKKLDNNLNIPDDNECIRIAKKYAKDTLDLPSYYEEISVSPVSHGDKTTNDYKLIAKQVNFFPKLNNMSVYGLMRLKVTVGDKGNIIEVYKTYIDIEHSGKKKCISSKVAFENIKNNKGMSTIDPASQKAKIKNIKMQYWAQGISIKEQPYLQPVWVFDGESTDENNIVKPFNAVVPAIE